MASKRSNNCSDLAELGSQRRKLVRTNVSASVSENVRSSNDNMAAERSVEICGMINRIKLKNILCHDLLDIDIFTPNINLLQGKNGSGKSAVVAAVIAGLGGHLRSTDRGNCAKSLIKNGKLNASIEIYLKNSGGFAYKHDQYGDEIVVKRNIASNGSSTYQIKAGNGNVIAKKKEDLVRILDYFNFQVENPLFILSQERAKSFLSSTDSRELFKFYMKATFLQQLKDGLVTISTNIESSKILVESKLESLTVLEKDVKAWEQKLQTVHTLEEKRRKLTSLKHEKAWAEIRDLEGSLNQKKKEASKEDSTMENLQTRVRNGTVKKKACESARKKLNDELIALVGSSTENESRRKETSDELESVKQRCRTEITKKKIRESEISDLDKDIMILKEKLKKDDDEVKHAWNIAHERLLAEKQVQENELLRFKGISQTEELQNVHLRETLLNTQKDYDQYEQEEKAIASRLNALRKELHSLQSNKNSMTIFGPNMPRILEEIDQADYKNAFSAKPIGPLGKHIKIKDQKWAPVAEQVIGKLMTAFLVSNNTDLYKLQSIFRRILPDSDKTPTIIITSFREKVHDFTRYLTGTAQYQSLWSCLDIDNIHVANTLLDQLNCEATLLIPSREEASQIMRDQSLVPVNCKKAYTLHGDNYFPDPNYKVYSGMGEKTVRYLQVSVEDRVKDLQKSIQNTTLALEESKEEKRTSLRNINSWKTEIANSDKKLRDIKNQVHTINRKFQEIANQETPPPPDMIQLQNELEEHEERKTEAQEKVTKINLSIEKIKSELKIKQNLHNEILKQSAVIQEQASKLQEDLNEETKNLLEYKRFILTETKKIELLEHRKNGTQSTINEIDGQLTAKMAVILTAHPERMETRRSIQDIEQQLRTLEKVLQKAEKIHGDPITVATTYKEKVKRYDETSAEIKSQHDLIMRLKASLNSRQKLFRFNRKLSSLVLSSSFKVHVAKRNLEGEISVNYDAESVEILMKKSYGKKKSLDGLQSLKMMSGGERSFATVSYIVALWELVNSPVRILDEFDIFMDVVSKKQCLDLIVQSVSKNVQYILVSPQEYSGYTSDQLTVFRMPDPERSGIRRLEQNDEEH